MSEASDVEASQRLHRLHIYDLAADAASSALAPQDKERVFTDGTVRPVNLDPKTSESPKVAQLPPFRVEISPSV